MEKSGLEEHFRVPNMPEYSSRCLASLWACTCRPESLGLLKLRTGVDPAADNHVVLAQRFRRIFLWF